MSAPDLYTYLRPKLTLGVVTRHHVFQAPSTKPPYTQGVVTLVTKSLECSILATCRTVNNESKSTLAPKLAKMRVQPLRLMSRSASWLSQATQHISLNNVMAALASRVVILPSPTSTIPKSSGDPALQAFAAKCVSYLSYAATPDAPTHQARDVIFAVVIAADVSPRTQAHEVVLATRGVWRGLGRFARSLTTFIQRERGFRQHENCLSRWQFDGRRLMRMPVKRVDEERWEEEWEEHEPF